MQKKFKRVLLKLSGEILGGGINRIIDQLTLEDITNKIKTALASGIQMAIVIGGGNICRGSEFAKLQIDRCDADNMGMLATIINSIALQSALLKLGISTYLCSAISIDGVIPKFNKKQVVSLLNKGHVVICAGGTGNSHLTTDTAAVLRAIELECDLLMKATKVDGVYDKDPMLNKNATHFAKLSYNQIIGNDLKVMDMTAIAMARDNNLSIVVFEVLAGESIANVLSNIGKFTIVN